MRNNILVLLAAVVILSGCDTYAGAGAYAGSQVGGMLGSFIGGISGGWRGSDVGGLIGMASGAAVGAVIGSAADAQQEAKAKARVESYKNRRGQHDNDGVYDRRHHDDNYLDETNSGDDRIDFTPSDKRSFAPNSVEIRRVRFIDSNGHDNSLSPGELSKVSMELFNIAPHDIYNVQVVIENASGNKHVQLSSPVIVERIASGKGVRYTAMIRADRRLKNGTVTLKAYVLQNGRQISRTESFTLVTKRR